MPLDAQQLTKILLNLKQFFYFRKQAIILFLKFNCSVLKCSYISSLKITERSEASRQNIIICYCWREASLRSARDPNSHCEFALLRKIAKAKRIASLRFAENFRVFASLSLRILDLKFAEKRKKSQNFRKISHSKCSGICCFLVKFPEKSRIFENIIILVLELIQSLSTSDS